GGLRGEEGHCAGLGTSLSPVCGNDRLSLFSMTQTATDTYRITGGNALQGRVRISGSKNGADYAIAAALLTADDVVLHNVPDIGDVRQMEEILEHFGATVEHPSPGTLRINAANLTGYEVPPSLALQLRASF